MALLTSLLSLEVSFQFFNEYEKAVTEGKKVTYKK